MRRILSAAVLLILIASPAYARHYGCTSHLGGISGTDLDALDITGASDPNPSNLADGDTAQVAVLSGTTGTRYDYVFDADGTTAEDATYFTVIRPDDFATAGVWRLVGLPIQMLPATVARLTGTINADEIMVAYDSNTFLTLTGAEFKAAYSIGSLSALNAGTMTDGLYCTYTAGVGIVCNSTGGTGDITGVLGDDSGDVPFLYQAWTAFGSGDATPDVSAAEHYSTADTTTITGFDHGAGSITAGRRLRVRCDYATVFDLTSSEITAANRSTDYTCVVGAVLDFVYGTDQWYALNVPDAYQTLSSSGIVVNNAGAPLARSIASGDGVTWTNGDGVAGNPTPAVAYPVLQSRTISDPADADDYNWFQAPEAITVSAVKCFAEGSTPSITADVQECDSAGANCATILSGAITCNGGWDAGTVSDTAIAANGTLRILLGAPSGTVSAVTVQVEGTR